MVHHTLYHWHCNYRVPLVNEHKFFFSFSCRTQYADNTFSSVWAYAGRLAIPSWKMELCAHHARTTSLSDSSAMPVWLSVLVKMVSMANERNPKTVQPYKPVTYFYCSCMYGHELRFGLDINSFFVQPLIRKKLGCCVKHIKNRMHWFANTFY